MVDRYIIGIDQSTQGTKAILMDQDGEIVDKSYLPHAQIISESGWVSHDGEEIFRNVVRAVKWVVEHAAINKNDVVAIGISNQRETTMAWDRDSRKPLEHAIVWQCARAQEIMAEITEEGFRRSVQEKTGIPLSPYFPAAKMAWLLRHNEQAQKLSEAGKLCLGTIDSWLIYRLTEGEAFKTDYSNASRTQLFNIRSLQWDSEICETLGIPKDALPAVESSDGDFGCTTLGGFFDMPVPIRAAIGDSHAALFGQGCIKKGMVKATYGTGSSIMMNIGREFVSSGNGLVTSLAWGRRDGVTYVLEGNINYTGAVITWFQRDLGLIGSAGETAEMARLANTEDQTYLVPAFSGLGAPYWRDGARAVFCGMSRTTGKKEMVKAGLECIVYQIADIMEAMSEDTGMKFSELRVDGGPTANDYLMQYQSDISCARILVPGVQELSAMGAAFMAGISAGLYEESIVEADRLATVYEPLMEEEIRERKYNGWKSAVKKSI